MNDSVLIISDQAHEDLTEIWLYIANDSTAAADTFIDLLFKQCQLLCVTPEMGRKRDDLLPGVRSLAFRRYIIFYRQTSTALEVVRILSAYRDIDAQF